MSRPDKLDKAEPVQADPLKPKGLRLVLLLFLFGACLVIPGIVATGLLLYRDAQAQIEQTERRLEQVAADLADDIDRQLDLLLANLTVLAGSPQLQSGDLKAFHERAEAALQPLGLQLLYRDLDGQQLMNTRRPWGATLPRSEQPEIDAVVRQTLKPHVSDVIQGVVAGRPIVTLTAPVQYGGALRGFLHMSIDPERLLAVLKGQKLPPEWNTILVDRKSVIIARLQRHEEYVGRALPSRLQPADGRIVRSLNLDNVEMLRVAKPSAVSGWQIAVGVPVQVARAQFVSNLWSMAGAALFLILLALVLAVTVARLIARPIRQVAGFAALVEDERITPPLASPVREANEVAAALRFASGRLSERTRELRDTLARFNAALQGADIVVFVQGRDRRITWISESAGYRAPNFVGKREEDLVDGLEERAKAIALREKVFATGQPQEGELTTGVGEQARNFRQRLQAMRDVNGDVVGVLGVSVEVTALRREQSRNTMLVRELAHRSKNLLAVVEAIARETLRSSGVANDFMDRFGTRLHSLARLQDLVVSGASGGVGLRELVRIQLGPFAEPGKRLEISGPDMKLRPEAANMLGMALHELATNATKYGSLSGPEGAVLVSCQLDAGPDGTQRFRLMWRESGGPPVVEPTLRGFGSKVVVDMTAATLDGRVELSYPSGGLVWRLDAPATIVVD